MGLLTKNEEPGTRNAKNKSEYSDLFLAPRTPVGRALPHHRMTDRCPANATRLALTSLCKQALLEVARVAIAVEKIAQGRATFADRLFKHFTDRIDQFAQPRFGDPAGPGCR